MAKENQPQAGDGNITSGRNISFWIDSVEPMKTEAITSDLQTEVVVVGAGIVGLSTAYRLMKEGKKVIVIEDGYIGSGETGRTTAHITNAIDDRYYDIQRMHGKEAARLSAESHTAAIDFTENIVRTENIDCEFKRVDGYLFLHETDERKTIDDEFIATREAGIDTALLENVPGIASEKGPSLKFFNQAQFHPLKYLHGLAKAIIASGSKIYTESHVTKISKENVEANGYTIAADHIVVATNTPVNDIVTMHTKQYPYRSYVIGATVPKGKIKHALWWDTGDAESKWITKPYTYTRLHEYNDQFDLLIVGGQDHKTAQADTEDLPEEDRYFALVAWARKRFPIEEVVYQWSGQVMEPIDSIAFIGRNPGDKNIYIATGDSGNGMTHGPIAAMLISDLINDKENKWEKLYDPSRMMTSSPLDFLKEAGSMAAQYVDLLTLHDIDSTKELGKGEGAIISKGLKKIALYRDDSGKLNAFSAICPHLGCVCHWNADEKSFDCPCHGSRFTYEGKVINGPAVSDLKRIEIKEDTE